MRRKLLTLPILSALCGVIVAACSGNRNDFSDYRQLPTEGWRYNNVLEFRPIHTDSLCRGHFVVALRHQSNYPYMNVVIEMAYTTPHGESIDTINMQLSDAYGEWMGCGIGTSFQVADTLGMVTHPSGTTVKLRQLMRTDTLPGIQQVGLFFVPQQPN